MNYTLQRMFEKSYCGWQEFVDPPKSPLKSRAVSFALIRILSRVSARNFIELAIKKLLLQRVNLSAIARLMGR